MKPITTVNPSTLSQIENDNQTNKDTVSDQNLLSSHLSSIQNSNTTIPERDHLQKGKNSVKVITKFMRKVIAAQSYGTMFTEGMNFQKLGYGMKPVNGKSSFSTLVHLDRLSKHYLHEIKEKTPNLNHQEVHLLAKNY